MPRGRHKCYPHQFSAQQLVGVLSDLTEAAATVDLVAEKIRAAFGSSNLRYRSALTTAGTIHKLAAQVRGDHTPI